ncbi:agarase [Agaribacterium haliotis]|uniref:agarase n=1 Tax=Agaribacterium haliotis TaxID=2013869 RepID=UPI001178C7CF|nr:agarase [Agaribacterium haliotis]
MLFSSSAVCANIEDTVTVDWATALNIGGERYFDRQKFITIHSWSGEQDWSDVYGENFSDNLLRDFIEKYDVYFGRDTGTIAWELNRLSESKVRSGFVSEEEVNDNAGAARWIYSQHEAKQWQQGRSVANRDKSLVVAGRPVDFWPSSHFSARQWSFPEFSVDNKKFGLASASFYADYLEKYFSQGDGDMGRPRPKYLEVINEPLYHLHDFPYGGEQAKQTLDSIFQFHNVVAKQVKSQVPDVLVGGYTAAFPDFDKNNFANWESRDKRFIDMAADSMDFISLHLYDFPNFEGRGEYRRGSNVEASLDLLEHYTTLASGTTKPFLITEYGAAVHQYRHQPWSKKRDGLKLMAINSLLMSFLDRPNQIEMAIPFITVKAEWGRVAHDIPYTDRLLIQEFERGAGQSRTWVYSELVKFYQFWRDVNGRSVHAFSDTPDVNVKAYSDGEYAYLILNSSDFKQREVHINSLFTGKVASVDIRHLYLNKNEEPVLDEFSLAELPKSVAMGDQATILLKIKFLNQPIQKQERVREKHYALEYKKAIKANKKTSFVFDLKGTAEPQQAVLRVGVGRDHGLTLFPKLVVNGVEISIPKEIKGYDQYLNGKGRLTFFGVLEVPIPSFQRADKYTVDLVFPDSGGYVSSMALQLDHLANSPELSSQALKQTTLKPI